VVVNEVTTTETPKVRYLGILLRTCSLAKLRLESICNPKPVHSLNCHGRNVWGLNGSQQLITSRGVYYLSNLECPLYFIFVLVELVNFFSIVAFTATFFCKQYCFCSASCQVGLKFYKLKAESVSTRAIYFIFVFASLPETLEH
jgi:hypothetical protein